MKFYPYEKREREKFQLCRRGGGGGHKKLWGSFEAVA